MYIYIYIYDCVPVLLCPKSALQYACVRLLPASFRQTSVNFRSGMFLTCCMFLLSFRVGALAPWVPASGELPPDFRQTSAGLPPDFCQTFRHFRPRRKSNTKCTRIKKHARAEVGGSLAEVRRKSAIKGSTCRLCNARRPSFLNRGSGHAVI